MDNFTTAVSGKALQIQCGIMICENHHKLSGDHAPENSTVLKS